MNDATCSTYTVRISPFDPPPFTEGFVNAVKKLDGAPISQRQSVFNSFIEEFGTHFLQQVNILT